MHDVKLLVLSLACFIIVYCQTMLNNHGNTDNGRLDKEHHSKISNKVMIVTKGTIARSNNSENGKNSKNSEDGKNWGLYLSQKTEF